MALGQVLVTEGIRAAVTTVIRGVGASDDPQSDVQRTVHRLWVLANIVFAESTFTLRRP